MERVGGDSVSISRPPTFDQRLIPKRINGGNQRPFVGREICQLILYVYIYIYTVFENSRRIEIELDRTHRFL